MRVSVNPDFVRANEVHRLCGDPAKLDSLLARSGIELVRPSLEQTLGRMLSAAAQSECSSSSEPGTPRQLA